MSVPTFSHVINSIPISYNTGGVEVKFDICFGQGKDAFIYKNKKDRTHFYNNYPIELFENEKNEKCYYVIGNEGPLVFKIKNPSIYFPGNNENEYNLGFAIDTNEPLYLEESNIIPYNIDRDGTMWTLPTVVGREEMSHSFDQNPESKYQLVIKKANHIDYEPTAEEKDLGMEKTTCDVGLYYLTFMILYKKKEIFEQKEVTRSIRGLGNSKSNTERTDSYAGRIGYGNSATTNSIKSEFKYMKGTERFVLPIRTRISKSSELTDINCSNTKEGAALNQLRKMTVSAPYYE